jgi:hypothetical protein
MTIMSPVLPGTPTSIGEQNAQAKLDSLVGINQILIATQSTIFEPESLGEHAKDIISDLLWNESDGPACLRDAAQQYLTEQPLSIKAVGHNFGWSADTWEIDHHEVLLTYGGPTCWVQVDADDSVDVYFYDDHHAKQRLRLTEEETEALQAFAWSVVV